MSGKIVFNTKIDPDEKQRIRIFLKNCKVIPLNKKVEITAIAFRRETGLKLPDAIIAATAWFLLIPQQALKIVPYKAGIDACS
jgi:predicted nucleic acid-binding protein